MGVGPSTRSPGSLHDGDVKRSGEDFQVDHPMSSRVTRSAKQNNPRWV